MERHKQAIMGPINAVPCPWCGTKNDFRELQEQMLLDKGCVVDCDQCHQKSSVVEIDTRPRIILRQNHRG
jgi:hypothetical protein